jgi:hypothetical protein
MRILYLANPSPDYLQDAVFHGLSQLLGTENVVELPANPQYHGESRDDRFSMLAFSFPQHPPTDLDEAVRNVDGIVIGSLREHVRPYVETVLALRDRPPTVFLDGEDDPYIRRVVRSVDRYFKREVIESAPRLQVRMPVRRIWHALRRSEPSTGALTSQIKVATARTRGIEALPFGVVDVGGRPSTEKDYDVAFAGGTQNASRALVTDLVDRLEHEGYRVFNPAQPVPWTQYLYALRRARIGISARGLGFDTYRYWEVPYAGALLVAERPRIVIPQNFVHEQEAILVEVTEIESAVREWLKRDDLPEVAAAGRAKVLSHHTSVHRAQTVLDSLTSV